MKEFDVSRYEVEMVQLQDDEKGGWVMAYEYEKLLSAYNELKENNEKLSVEVDFFKDEVKLRNRIPATADTTADLLRRAEKAESELSELKSAIGPVISQMRDDAFLAGVKWVHRNDGMPQEMAKNIWAKLPEDYSKYFDFESNGWVRASEYAKVEDRVKMLEASRIAYASEFPNDADGDPDVGNIHANIRKLKKSISIQDFKDSINKLRVEINYDKDMILYNDAIDDVISIIDNITPQNNKTSAGEEMMKKLNFCGKQLNSVGNVHTNDMSWNTLINLVDEMALVIKELYDEANKNG